MCGFAGYWQFNLNHNSAKLLAGVAPMATALSHRGPDDYGSWADPGAGIAIGHRRLAILDISSAGHQPMLSSHDRFVIAFNGEIYNHLELREDLAVQGAATRWRSYSDTETLLTAFEHWGIEATLQRCVGMFSIALWDRFYRTLTLVRDRFGEKPLYYGWAGKQSDRAFVFGSELKAIKAYPGFNAPISREAIGQYLGHMYIPAPRTIYQEIYKLEPGGVLTVHGRPPVDAPAEPLVLGKVHSGATLGRWWSLAAVVGNSDRKQLTSENEVLGLLEKGLTESVRSQLLADVPLGAFLSGGVDSSTIVALMQSQSSCPVKTFTIGFDEAGFDESPHALAVARHLGTDHHEIRVSAQMARDLIPSLPWMYDEPFADSSQIPTHLVCKGARRHVTVALTGDGGDELFGGYNRYFWAPKVWDWFARMPFPLRKLLGIAIQRIPISGRDVLSGTSRVSRLSDRAHKLATRLRFVQDMDDLNWSLVTEWQDPASVVRGLDEALIFPRASDSALPVGLDSVELMMFRDAMTYLPDDILCKVDRAAMACSLETRVPFLDHRVVELAWRMPINMKIRGNTGKWALRQVLYKYVPKELIERPKVGFAIPIGQWLRGPLRDWAEDLLSESRLSVEGYFYAKPIRQAWAEHLTGRRDNTSKIWSILMFQAWLQEQSRSIH